MKIRIPPLIGRGLSLAALAVLAGCKGGIFEPKGQVAADEKTLIITALLLMLLVVLPVIVMTLTFAWKYRASNEKATYAPKWSHSNKIEITVWGIPCLIIIVLAAITWQSTHALDPYRPLQSEQKPITIQAVSLNWKWLFIYPELNIATVNQIAFPANVPVDFKITSDTVMNSFFIPQLGSQVYSMAGMTTQVHLIANEPGTFDGMSANYSGQGFTGMKFKAIATKTPAEFNAWVAKVRAESATLDAQGYTALAKPSENNPVAYYGKVSPGLFTYVLNKYMPNMKAAANASGIQDPSNCQPPASKE